MSKSKLDLTELRNHIVGDIVDPKHPHYERLRNTFAQQGAPAAIVQCQNEQDVATTILYARDKHLELAVRSGGHGIGARSTNDGGLVVDLTRLKQIEVIDEAQRIVRIGGGATWGDVGQRLHNYGLALSSGDSVGVGVGGLTLGGGIGWQVRQQGLTIDSLLAATVVTANGSVIRTTSTDYADLFWALRGGGGNFGIVTSFEFQAHSLKNVLSGSLTYAINDLEKVLTGWARYMPTAPEELNTMITILPGFGPQPVPALKLLICCAADSEARARAAVAPLLKLGPIQHQELGIKPYYQILDKPSPPQGHKMLSQSGFVKDVDKAFIRAVATNYGRANTPILQIRSLGGAVRRVRPRDTAFAHRDYEALLRSIVVVPADTPAKPSEQLRKASWAPLKPFTRGSYVNFLTEVGSESLAASYPAATYHRLAAIKAKYDPDNLFHINANIKPAEQG